MSDSGATAAVGGAAPAGGRGRDLTAVQVGAEWFHERGGGLNRFYHDLLHHLPAAGVRCRGLVAGTAAGWPADPAGAGVSVRAFAPMRASLLKRWAGERRALREELAAGRFDVAVTHFAPYAFPVLDQLTAAGPAGGRRPMVVHFQGPWARESRAEGGGRLACRAKGAIERAVYRRATRLIVLSTPFKQMLTSEYGVDPARVDVVPGGVECDRFAVPQTRAEARAALGWPAGRPTVLAVRRLARRMGLENLVEAAEAVRRAVPDVLVHLAGGGAERANLEEAIRRRGLEGTVKLLGFVPDDQLPLAYRAADVTVVPTVSLEGFGLVAAESLAAGTPAVATPVDGLVELLGPLSGDLLTAGSTAADLAAGLTRALSDRSALPTAEACAAYARRRFDWGVIAAAVTGVYRAAVAQG